MSVEQDAIKAAMGVARDIAEGRLDPGELAAVAEREARAAFARVVGPEDALWPVHVDVARQVIGLGAIPVDELAEWVAVFRASAGRPPAASWIETALATGTDEETEEE